MRKVIIGTTVVAVGLFIGLMVEPERKPNVVEKDPIMKGLEEGKTSTEIYEELIKEILDKNDTPQDDLLKKVNKDTAIFMSRTYVFLRAPRHYMGFIVSPLPFADTFDKQYRIGTSGFNYRPLDFFSSAVPNRIMDGEWYHRVKAGARYMGQLLNLYYVPDYDMPERTFSILLYEKPRPLHTSVAEYTIELLLPENPDLEIQKAFQWMKSFVEKLRYNTFNPLYTSDMRLMNGRYFRVTVNKCGWLVEDYLDICN